LGSLYALSETVKRMIPLAIIGAGLAVSFQASVWNIGAEGQMLIGAIVGTWVALFSPFPPSLLLPVMFVLGFLGGALWGTFAAWCRNRLAINEIITTLMLNYVAANLVLYLILGPWKGKNGSGICLYRSLSPGGLACHHWHHPGASGDLPFCLPHGSFLLLPFGKDYLWF